jgi:hypothetical protein
VEHPLVIKEAAGKIAGDSKVECSASPRHHVGELVRSTMMNRYR